MKIVWQCSVISLSLLYFSHIAIDCGSLKEPSGGSVVSSLTTLWSIAMYSCRSGYLLSGNMTRQCLADGNWSEVMPECIRMLHTMMFNLFLSNYIIETTAVDCGPLENVEGGNVTVNATSFQSVAVYICVEGHVMVNGSRNRTCQAGGNWSGIEPSCVGRYKLKKCRVK